jgi:hypothetical protein
MLRLSTRWGTQAMRLALLHSTGSRVGECVRGTAHAGASSGLILHRGGVTVDNAAQAINNQSSILAAIRPTGVAAEMSIL